MSWKQIDYRLKGDSPIIVKCSKMANPLNPFSKELKAVSSKRVKTDADYAEMARIEFVGSLYMHSELGPVIPGANVEAAILAAAKKTKEGPLAKCAVFSADPGYFKLDYVGPRTAKELFEDTTARGTPDAEGFRFTVPVSRQQAKIISTRPIFHDWSVDVSLMYEDSIINFAQLDRWLRKAGTMCGLCEWRPRFGRFSVECLSKIEEPIADEDSGEEDAPKPKKRRPLVKV